MLVLGMNPPDRGLQFVLRCGGSLATLRALDYNRLMSTVSTTLAVGDEASGVIAEMRKLIENPALMLV